MSSSKRPRGGEIWRAIDSGQEVRVDARQRVRPMAGVRPHSDMVWSMVMVSPIDREGLRVLHEADFVREHVFVRQDRS